MASSLSKADLEARFRRYIDNLNTRRLDEAAAFYHDPVLVSGAEMTRAEWKRACIDQVIDAIPDWHWRIDDILIDGGRVALRLTDTGTPTREILGLVSSGERMRVNEHAFYRIVDGKISEVYSVLDVHAAQLQLESGKH